MAAPSGPSATVDIRLLGGVQARAADGSPLDVGPAKCQLVLATLALSVGSAVPVPRLVEAVWGEDPPRTAERTVQSYLARLRGALGAGSIDRRPGSYRLALPADAVDVSRFERLLDAGDLEAALAEWRGEPLAGLEAPGLEAAVIGLTERWLAAVEQDLEARVESEPAACVGRLSALTAAHPFREGLWALLMTALYRVGRQADALAAYRTARDRLAEALGVEPGERLRELEVRILRQDAGLGTGAAIPADAGTEPALPTGTVTFGFVDVEGAASHWGRDPTAMAAAMKRHHERVRDLARRHGGHVFTQVGDAYGAVFDVAERAAAWAEALQAAEPHDVSGQAVLLRIGLHTGEAEQHAGSYFGPAVHLASRLAAVGHGGQTLASAATAGLLATPLRDLGRWSLDGAATDLTILQVDPGEHPPLRTADRHRGNLPRRLPRLVGRDEELSRLRTALGAHRLVSLVGPGGIGKTSLALAAAREHATSDGWLVELATIRSPSDVPRAVAEVLGVTERQGADLVRSITDSLRSRGALLVLDNCEHVVDAAAQLAAAVLMACPDVTVLATSRERLGLTDERVVTVPRLELDPAVALFVERARALDPTVDGSANRAAIAEICDRLDGIPLAIELAAARTAALGLDDLRERLHRRMRVLDGTRRSGAERHRTLWSAIRWSYDLLAPEERAVFRRLAIFTGPFDLAAAEWVVGGGEAIEVTNAVGRLAEQSLVTVESGPFGRRFRLLEPIREFGREQLDAAGTTELLAERHARWCWCEVTGVHRLLAGWDEHEGVARLAELWPNLRSAFDWACGTGRLELARALLAPILSEIVVRSANELGDWGERLLAAAPDQDGDSRVLGLYAAAHRYSMTQDPHAYDALAAHYDGPDHVLLQHARAIASEDYAQMVQWAPLAEAELRERGDDHLAERAAINVAAAWLNLGELGRADALLEVLIDRYRRQGPPTFLSWTLFLRGYSALFQEDKTTADRCFAEGVEIELPPRTHTPAEPLKARAAFRRGEHIPRLPHPAGPHRRAPGHGEHAGRDDGLHRVRRDDGGDRSGCRGGGRAGPPRGRPPARRTGLAPAGGRARRHPARCPRDARDPRRPRRPGVHAWRLDELVEG